MITVCVDTHNQRLRFSFVLRWNPYLKWADFILYNLNQNSLKKSQAAEFKSCYGEIQLIPLDCLLKP